MRCTFAEGLTLVEDPLHRAPGQADERFVHDGAVIPEIHRDDRFGDHGRRGVDHRRQRGGVADHQRFEREPRDGGHDAPDVHRFSAYLDRANGTSLDPHALLFTLHKIEKKFGRDRAHERRWGPRTLDVDVLWVDGHTVHEDDLEVPHPRMWERGFVLIPLADLAPDLVPEPPVDDSVRPYAG